MSTILPAEIALALESFCAPRDLKRPALERPYLCTPFGYGQEWTVASDGRRLIAAQGRHSQSLPLGDGPENTPQVFAGFPVRFVGRLHLRDLKNFLGIPAADAPPCERCGAERLIQCDAGCMGLGELTCTCHCGNDHPVNCRTCDGTGKLPCPDCGAGFGSIWPVSHMVLNGVPFNEKIVAATVRVLPDAVVNVYQDEKDATKPILFSALDTSWLCVVMPIRLVDPAMTIDAIDRRFEIATEPR